MTAILQRYTLLVVLFLSLTLGVSATPAYTLSKTDGEMLKKAQLMQMSLHTDHGDRWENVQPDIDYSHVNNLQWEAAADGKARKYTHVETVSSVLPFRSKKVYFYSLIHPGSHLGQIMRLQHDQVASLLWKHEKDEPKVIHIDTLKHRPGVNWGSMQDLREVLLMH